MKKKLHCTIGIPTCYGGRSLISAVTTMRAESPKECTISVIADSVPFTEDEKHQLEKLDVQFTENKSPASQITKVGQLVAQTTSEIFIFTQDDVRFTKTTIKEILNCFEANPELTMVAARILPEKSTKKVSLALMQGIAITDSIIQTWNNGDNYLASNGRCLAFRTSHLKKFRFPSEIIGTDAFLYFENQRLGGTFHRLESAEVYDTVPSHFKEHLNQTSRFQFSEQEIQPFFSYSLRNQYAIPIFVGLIALLKRLLRSPIYTTSYMAILLLSKIKKNSKKTATNPFWTMDASTKLH